MAAYKVLIPQKIAEEGISYLRERGYEIKMGSGNSLEEIKRDVVDCDAILARLGPFTAEVLEAGKKLKVISRHGVGVDNIDVKKATELGIYITNAPESNSNTVAELALGLIIALARNLIAGDKAVRKGDFEFRNRQIGMDLEDKTLGVLGIGKIGRRLCQKAYYGLSMKVIGYDPFLRKEDFPEVVEMKEERDTIFSKSDFISVHIPSTAETKKSIGIREFNLMKPTAFFINVARGDLVVEEDLAQALREGLIRGAAVDVYEKEPPPSNHPFFELDNIIMTPHNAALTKECMIRMAVQAAQGIDEVLSGKTPTWPVNKPEKTRI
ncbi:MAG: Phosphoglycerate dehydrogenase [candidate division TA06 bacterium 34_109]|uniref:Phosphoglycerate dehydrogenase n=1 Tax=candidate division TA06 bacterium 34_109 TaxID=1635277 RepID=A0A117M627_UNCT6|nr:MAG: Phosphoglycerate dehydrogenase [candidate division TA06 bacterium 34_109]